MAQAAALAAVALLLHTQPTSGLDASLLYVDEAPDYVRPYVIEHYKNSHAVTIDSQLYRFMVTGPSSGNAFSLLSTNSPSSDSLGVLPHIHQTHYENFFNFKGRFQLWGQKEDREQQARVIGPGDYGSVPRNTTHTFQILDPDTEMVGVIVPGGFEELFYALGTNFSSGIDTPYVPASASNGSSAGPNSTVSSALENFDVYAQLEFTPRRDIINGSAPTEAMWHTGANELGDAGEPYFIANGYGPKYLSSDHSYQIVQPLVTPEQAQDLSYSLSTISISRPISNDTTPTYQLEGASAFEVLEGQLTIKIDDYDDISLIGGDVAFIPANVTFSYWSRVAFTKVLFIGTGSTSLDTQLVRAGELWDYLAFPVM
ncbi:quercetin 2,3-dioxygenase [Thozetella sp. PMI_491]|nr:quercetin 2,3-dioxygenase [Thozetella sp. PMI_491]